MISFKNTLFACVVLGVILTAGAQDAQVMYAKASALTKLSSAVEAHVLYKQLPAQVSDNELLTIATSDNEALLGEFDGLEVRVQREPEGIVLLVCSRVTGTALLEDASCTAKLDAHHWRDARGASCEFTLKAATVCSTSPNK